MKDNFMLGIVSQALNAQQQQDQNSAQFEGTQQEAPVPGNTYVESMVSDFFNKVENSARELQTHSPETKTSYVVHATKMYSYTTKESVTGEELSPKQNESVQSLNSLVHSTKELIELVEEQLDVNVDSDSLTYMTESNKIYMRALEPQASVQQLKLWENGDTDLPVTNIWLEVSFYSPLQENNAKQLFLKNWNISQCED